MMVSVLRKHYFSFIVIPMILLYFIVLGMTARFGSIIATIASNLVLIVGTLLVIYLDSKFRDSYYISKKDLSKSSQDIGFSYVLIGLLWFFGQFVFLWVYKNIGDSLYSNNYSSSFNDTPSLIWTLLLILVVAPIAEELVFRYLLFGRLLFKQDFALSWLKYIGLILLSTLLFGFIHGTMMHQIVVLPLGLILCLLMYKTNRIIFPILGHMLFNSLSIVFSWVLRIYEPLMGEHIFSYIMIAIYILVVVGISYFVISRK
jgi:CAAX amino terminal protease family protease